MNKTIYMSGLLGYQNIMRPLQLKSFLTTTTTTMGESTNSDRMLFWIVSTRKSIILPALVFTLKSGMINSHPQFLWAGCICCILQIAIKLRRSPTTIKSKQQQCNFIQSCIFRSMCMMQGVLLRKEIHCQAEIGNVQLSIL